MKSRLSWTILLVAAVAVSGAAEAAKALKTQKQRFSYTIGYDFGTKFKRQGMDFDNDIVIQAIRDALEEKKPKLTREQMQTAINNYKEKKAAQHKEISETNLKLSKAFLKQNKKKKGVKVTASGLQYEILKAGTGARPKATDKVEVHYHGTLIDGRVFDSSVSRGQSVTLPAGGDIIKGWQEALQKMKKGAKWRIAIPPDLAYGEMGRPPIISPNMALVFEIELIDIK